MSLDDIYAKWCVDSHESLVLAMWQYELAIFYGIPSRSPIIVEGLRSEDLMSLRPRGRP